MPEQTKVTAGACANCAAPIATDDEAAIGKWCGACAADWPDGLKDSMREMLGIVKRIEPVVDDLMGEISGASPVQNWGAVNALLLSAATAIRNVEGEG